MHRWFVFRLERRAWGWQWDPTTCLNRHPTRVVFLPPLASDNPPMPELIDGDVSILKVSSCGMNVSSSLLLYEKGSIVFAPS